jgi:release factor glutamine methyltransferase
MPTEAAVVAELRAAGCVFAEDEARLLVDAATTPDQLRGQVARRVAGEPLEHILGWAQFRGLRVAVDPGVFVPRRRTEFLVELASSALTKPAVVVELCCGCGAVSAALAGDGVDLHAVDIDSAATACARRNVIGSVYTGDLFAPLPVRLRGMVDVVVANAPYVPTDEIVHMPAEAREHEPHIALDGGADGLAVQRRIVAAAPEWLTTNGHLMIETSARQSAELAQAFDSAGFAARVERNDDLDATVLSGRLR